MRLKEREKREIEEYWHKEAYITIERRDYYILIYPRYDNNALRGVKFHNKKTGEEIILLHPNSEIPLKNPQEGIAYLRSITGEESEYFLYGRWR